MNKQRVWALYRVSTDRQGAEGDDIPMQRNVCQDYAEAKGWTIENELSEKLSGYKTNLEDRDALHKIRQGAEAGEFDILLVYHSDRLGRQMEYSLFIAKLYELGIQVWSAKEDELGGGEHINSLLLSIRYWQSEGESKKTSMRVKDAMAQLNEEGAFLGGVIPYGYKLHDTGEKRNSKKDKTIKVLKQDEDEAKIVKLIFDWVVEKHWGGSLIAQELNSMGLQKRGKIWRHNSVTRLLRNPTYMGYKTYNVMDTSKRGSMKATKREEWKLQPFNADLVIVPEEQFKKVQDIMDKRYKQSGGMNKLGGTPSATNVLLSGMAVCGYCGHSLKADFSIKKNVRKDGSVKEYKTYRYRCGHAKNGIEKHNQMQWGAKGIDAEVEAQVMEAVSSIDLEAFNQEKDSFDFKELDSRKVQLKDLKDQYETATTALTNVEKLFDDVMSGKSGMSMEFVSQKMEEYGSNKMELFSKIEKLEQEIKDAEMTSTDLDKLNYQLKDWVNTYSTSSSMEQKKQMLSQVVKEVAISKESIVIKFNITVEKALEGSIDSGVSNGSNGTPKGTITTTFTPDSFAYTALLKQWSANKSLQFDYEIQRTA